MSGVRIVTDSSCDLTADEAAGLRVEVVPLSIRFGDEEFVDREELSIAFSEDEGKNWTKPAVIARRAKTSIAYPYVFEYQP